jgi:hypothetical protein
MSKHRLSTDDWHFLTEFETGGISPDGFDHRAHVRLAYAYLTEHEPDTAVRLMRGALMAFLRRNDIDISKYHETMTNAWILAVRHFMATTPAAPSADAFIDANPILLDSKIMLTHYSADLLFSDRARARFVEPNIERIPRH